MKVWVLTSEVNEYDQQGEYFEGVYASKPTAEQLMKDHDMSADDATHVLTGGGRRNKEYQWFWLRERNAGVAIPRSSQQERARQLAEDWHEGVPKDQQHEWACRAAGLLLHFADGVIASDGGQR